MLKSARLKIAILLLTIWSGCVTATPDQQRWYALYKSDSRAPKSLEQENGVNQWEAAALSLLCPGLGHIYLDEYGYAIIWFFAGLISPFVAPVAAVADARTVNEIRIADAYQIYMSKIKERHTMSDDVATVTFCPSCDGQMRADARYCPYCGRSR